MSRRTEPNTPAFFVGGLGGSGTRAVAEILQKAGFFIGFDLNRALDNLTFTLIFNDPKAQNYSDSQFSAKLSLFYSVAQGLKTTDNQAISILENEHAHSRFGHSASWIQARILAIKAADNLVLPDHPWGWKEPNSHIFSERILGNTPEVRYVYVQRNAMDMCLSRNQRQLRNWGKFLFGSPVEHRPRFTLKLWLHSRDRFEMLRLQHPERCLLFDMDAAFENPKREVLSLLSFVTKADPSSHLNRLANIIKRPESSGRGAGLNPNLFDRADLDRLRRYDTTS